MATKAGRKSITKQRQRRTAVKRGDLPPLRLSAEEMAARAKDAEQLEALRREFDPLLIAKERGWPPAKKRRKAKRKRGAPVEFNLNGEITAAAKAVADRGGDDSCAKFIERVYLELQDRRINKAPGLTWMKQHIGPIYRRKRREARRGR